MQNQKNKQLYALKLDKCQEMVFKYWWCIKIFKNFAIFNLQYI